VSFSVLPGSGIDDRRPLVTLPLGAWKVPQLGMADFLPPRARKVPPPPPLSAALTVCWASSTVEIQPSLGTRDVFFLSRRNLSLLSGPIVVSTPLRISPACSVCSASPFRSANLPFFSFDRDVAFVLLLFSPLVFFRTVF